MAYANNDLRDWRAMGFSRKPRRIVAQSAGVTLYRCWGSSSTELGTGYFSAVKPISVIDAELKFNIVDWGNSIVYVSTFKLKSNFEYFIGPVGHGLRDCSIAADQIYVPPPLEIKVQWVGREVLKQDASVLLLNDRNTVEGKERGQA